MDGGRRIPGVIKSVRSFPHFGLSKKHECDFGLGVGLCEHRCGCLNQHVVLGQSCTLRGDVHVDDPSVGRLQVALLPGHLVGGETQAGHGCSVVRTQGGNVLHRLSEDSHGDVRQIDRTWRHPPQ